MRIDFMRPRTRGLFAVVDMANVSTYTATNTIPGLLLTWLLLAQGSGCELSKVEEPKRMPLAPVGIAPVGGDPLNPPPANPSAKPAAAVEQPAAAQPARPADNKGLIGKTTAKVVNAKEARQNPNVKEVENKITGSDPLTVATSAYVSLRAKPQILAFQAALKQIKALEERNPTYDEFMELMQANHIEFAEIYPWQMYGYDPDTGGIVILEDGQKKAEIYKAAGLNPD